MRTAVVLFTRDLRVHDNPALAAAVREAEQVVPLFVRDDALRGGPNRLAFLDESLADLDASLRARGGALVVRRGGTAREVERIVRETRAEAVHASRDVSANAERRSSRLAGTVPLRLHDGVTVHPPDELHPYRVFSPFFRAWQGLPLREPEPPPGRIVLPGGLDPGQPRPSSGGGESAGRARMAAWLRDGAERYGDRDRLDLDATSRLSPYLHFGCVSALELARQAPADFVRQLAWRDFYAQLLFNHPETAHEDFRDRGDSWDGDPDLFDAWREGQTGYPVVDAGMRQLRVEGWMSNRVRMITASFLTKHLYLDWRLGAAHFFRHLLDGDVANNVGNWQWVAGTGVDTRPNRVLNPTLQARRHDPNGDYVRSWLPELGGRGYPKPVVTEALAPRRRRSTARTP
jgi:deoxyribodipyrimidine photo-lyase